MSGAGRPIVSARSRADTSVQRSGSVMGTASGSAALKVSVTVKVAWSGPFKVSRSQRVIVSESAGLAGRGLAMSVLPAVPSVAPTAAGYPHIPTAAEL